jgi:hypothetical protein
MRTYVLLRSASPDRQAHLRCRPSARTWVAAASQAGEMATSPPLAWDCPAADPPLAGSDGGLRRHHRHGRISNSSIEDTWRGMSRGTNHSTREATSDTRGEQKAQAGRQKASATTTSTGLRRRLRRFESYRGHHVMSHDIDIGPSLRVRPFCCSGASSGLVVAGGVEDQFAQEFASCGVDDADVAVLDE